MGTADLNAVFYGAPKKKNVDEGDDGDALTSATTSAAAEKPKERKHILSVWIIFL